MTRERNGGRHPHCVCVARGAFVEGLALGNPFFSQERESSQEPEEGGLM